MSPTFLADRAATTEAPILDVLAERWSTRIFDAEAPLDEEAFASALEAARWAPSAGNSQPWSFIVARRGTAAFASIVESLVGFNQMWASHAAALVVAVADTVTSEGKPQPWAIYDLGQSVAHFTVQAHAGGLSTHQMGGFDRTAVRAAFDLGETLEPITVVAVGALGDVDAADAALREREVAPRTRKPMSEILLVNE